MRKYISYLMFAVAAAFFTGCIDVNVTPIEPQEPTMVTLQLTNADLVATRAITDDNLNNEDLIKSVQCFFAVAGSDAVVYATELIPVNTQQTKTLSLAIPAESLSTLFANNATQCDVYVLANYGTKITDNRIATIKAKDITLGTGATQESFVMDGTAKVTLNGTALYGKVELKRAAAKIVVKANIKTSITEGSVTWTPNIEGIQMSYLGSVKGSKISAEPADAVITEEDTNPYTQTTDVFEGTTTEQLYVGYQKVPFYSFPVEASANKGEIDITIPWNPGNGDDVLYKYQVPIDIALERNHVYLIEVIVDVLGNAEGATLTPSYVVVNWTENPITTGLSRPKYLVVDEHNYVMNNETSLEIPFNSSDNCIIKSITCRQQNLKTGEYTTVTKNNDATTITNKTYKAVIDNETGKVTITHGLNNNLYDLTDGGNGVFDFTPYEFELVIQHDGDTRYQEPVTIIQYPAMYGTASQNSDYSNGGGTNSDNGFVFVNGYQGTPPSGGGSWWPGYDDEDDETVTNFGGAHGLSSSGDLNAVSMYTITTTSLPEGSGYIIGDPRTTTVDNLSTWNDNTITWASAPALYDNASNRTLKYYYPTDANLSDGANSPTYNMISPKFRVCSAYGAIANEQTNRRYYENVEGRCASYQEDGYPAGRWRLPTKAEFEIINTLTNSGMLPTLFVTTMDYWCAHGYGRYKTTTNKVELTHNDMDYGDSSVSVRCVYDEWYWGSEPALEGTAKDTFTWGDIPRN